MNTSVGALDGVYFFVVLFLVVLAILWFFLPFAIFGTKSKLDSLIHEMKSTNIELGEIRKQLSANAQPSQPEASRAQTPSKRKLTHDEIMSKYKISNDGEKYIFQGYRYDQLEDAVAYALKYEPS